jgi:uncharacterized protein
MSQRYIDGFEFGGTGGSASGSWAVADLPRLQDLLRSNAGEVSYRIEGTRDSMGRPALEVSVKGVLQLTCQRCLEALPYRFDAQSVLVLARNMAEIEADDAMGVEAPERVLAGREMPVRDMIEDEVLLLVPIAQRHEHCEERPGRAAGRQESPFAGLRGLLDGGKTS